MNAGPAAEQMFRDFSKLSAADQERLAEFAKLLTRAKAGRATRRMARHDARRGQPG